MSLAAVRPRLARLGATARRVAPETLLASAILLGWGLLTWGLIALAHVWQLWPLSAGLLVLSLCGWRLLAVIAWQGLYTLSADEDAS